MQVVACYSLYGYTLEVFDESGFLLEDEMFGNVEAHSSEVVTPDDPRALPMIEIERLCETAAHEKAALLGCSDVSVSVLAD